MPEPMSPLAGLRVLDLTDELGLYAGKLLAWLGADVIRPTGGRAGLVALNPPFVTTDSGTHSLYDLHYNLAKHRLDLDVDSPSGRAALLDLVADCHALIESGSHQQLLSSRLGAELTARRPDLVRVSITPFGASGRLSEHAGGDLVVAARSGLLWLNGSPEQPPYRPAAEQAAHMAGLVAAGAAMIGLVHQQRTGTGSFCEVPAVFAATLATLQSGNANWWSWQKRLPARRGLGLPFARMLFPAADGWTAFQALPGQWDNLVALLSRFDAAADLGDESYRDPQFRVANAEHINAVIEGFTRARPKQWLMSTGQSAGIAALPVNAAEDIYNDHYLAARGFFQEVDEPATGLRLRLAGPPFKLSSRSAAPLVATADANNPTPAGTPPHAGDHLSPSGSDTTAGNRAASTAVNEVAGRPLPWLPLQGVRVLDFTWMIAGPLGTRLLSNFGAEVIKVESYNRVDRVRETGPHPLDKPWSLNEDGSFNDVNLGKESLLLNLNLPEAQDLARQLVATADIVACNFTGDRMDRWGLGYEDLAKIKPDLIYLNLPVFERSGERRRWGGYGSHINALAGFNALSGFPGDPPYGLGPLYPDFSGNPYHAMTAVLAALRARDEDGQGQYIEIGQYDSTISILGPALLQVAATGKGPEPMGNHSDRMSPHNVYRCRDREPQHPAPVAPGAAAGNVAASTPGGPDLSHERWIAIECGDDAAWAALCQALGHPEWRDDPRFVGLPERKTNEAALDALMQAAVSAEDADKLAERLQQAGVAAAPVLHLADLLEDPWYRAEYFAELPSDEGATFMTHAEPSRPFGHKQPVRRAPMMGEHTDDVLARLLALDRPEIDRLYAEGVLA